MERAGVLNILYTQYIVSNMFGKSNRSNIESQYMRITIHVVLAPKYRDNTVSRGPWQFPVLLAIEVGRKKTYRHSILGGIGRGNELHILKKENEGKGKERIWKALGVMNG